MLHAHYAIPHAICAYLARQVAASTEAPRRHDAPRHRHHARRHRNRRSARITRFGIDQSDGVTAVSEFLRQKTVEVFRPPARDPGDPELRRHQALRAAKRSGAAARATQFAKKGERILIHISNFRPSKRVEDAVRVFAAVRREVPSVLLMVGDGPSAPGRREVAVELGVERLRAVPGPARRGGGRALSAATSSSSPARTRASAWPRSRRCHRRARDRDHRRGAARADPDGTTRVSATGGGRRGRCRAARSRCSRTRSSTTAMAREARRVAVEQLRGEPRGADVRGVLRPPDRTAGGRAGYLAPPEGLA